MSPNWCGVEIYTWLIWRYLYCNTYISTILYKFGWSWNCLTPRKTKFIFFFRTEEVATSKWSDHLVLPARIGSVVGFTPRRTGIRAAPAPSSEFADGPAAAARRAASEATGGKRNDGCSARLRFNSSSTGWHGDFSSHAAHIFLLFFPRPVSLVGWLG